MAKKSTYYTSEVRITFTGNTPIDENGNKEQVDIISKAVVALIHALKTTFPDIKTTQFQDTTYDEKPLEVTVTTKKL